MLNIVKNTTFINPLDLIAPHSCRGCGHIGCPLCNHCKNYIIKEHQSFCPQCKAPRNSVLCLHCSNLPPIYFVGERSGLLNELVHFYKYSSARVLAQSFAELINHFLPVIDEPVTIVPLPTISQHIRSRGFDHTYLIAKKLAKLHRGWQVSPILLRTHNFVQVGSSKAKRKSQATKAYEINPKITINPSATYLLLDDVWTTGASMLSAHKKLSQAGASKIIISILAVSRI